MIQEPLIPNIGVCALVPDQWNGNWQPRHYVLTRLAHYFHIVWVSPAPEWRVLLKGWGSPTSQLRDSVQPPGFIVHEPELWLPKLYRPEWLARLTFNMRVRRARRLLIERGCQKIILYLWRADFADALLAAPFDLSCYHIDDEYSFSDSELPLDEGEKRLMQQVDQVFIHSQGLLERKGGINPHTSLVPNGVDYKAYAEISTEPLDIMSILHPRIGYTGTIKRQLDWRLLLHLSIQHPEWSFVFIGPQAPHPDIREPIEELSRRTNVHFLGAKSVHELTAYPQHFDVCIMPYQVNDYTKYIYPLKLHEYLASGSPTVGARIRSLEEFTDVVALANTQDEWSASITEALNPTANAPERRTIRQAVARQHDWNLLVLRIAKIMAGRLGQEFADQLAKALESFIEREPVLQATMSAVDGLDGSVIQPINRRNVTQL